MDTKIISKSLVMSHRQCPRRAWLESRGEVPMQYSAESTFGFEQGKAVHALARAAMPEGVMVPQALTLPAAAEVTRAWLDGGTPTLFEAGFVAGRLGVRCDLLEQADDGLLVTEVKSSGSVKPEQIEDCAIQHACLSLAGVPVKAIRIAHVDGTTRGLLVFSAISDGTKS